MLPETLVTLICTLDQSGSCCALADCPQTSAAPSNAESTPARTLLLISLLLRKSPEILSFRSGEKVPAKCRRHVFGFELVGRIRSRPEFSIAAIIVLASASNPGDGVRCRNFKWLLT